MGKPSELNEKSQVLLKMLVEQYIQEGQPIPSKMLADSASVTVSPATVRNIMADLEDLGYVSSPHTSAGRVPTNLAYRFFVDTLVKVDPLDTYDLASLNKSLDPDMTSQELIESASGLLSEFTRMAGLVTLPKREQVTLRHVEFQRPGFALAVLLRRFGPAPDVPLAHLVMEHFLMEVKTPIVEIP